MKRHVAIMLFCALFLALTSARAQAAVPLTLTQQGRLLNADGTPVTSPVRMIFNIYDSSSSTTPLWTETQSNVMLDSGAFSVQLGSVTPFPATVWNGQTVYLGVTVGNDPEMTPREQITSVPYALMCGQADNATSASQLGGVAAGSYQRALSSPDCGAGKYIQKIDVTGTVTCGTDQNSGGTVSSVSASNGLTASITGSGLSIGRAFTFDTQTATSSGTASFYADANCLGGYTLVSGGCNVGDINSVVIAASYPSSNTSWHCTCRDNGTATVTCTAYARCLAN